MYFALQWFRYLTLSTTFNQLEINVSLRQITFLSDAYVQAINGETFGGQFACYLSSGVPLDIGTSYDVLTDFHNCSTASGGFNMLSLSTTVGVAQLFFYYGSNGPCSTLYGPLVMEATGTSPLIRDASSVGGAVYVRVGDTNCDIGSPECPVLLLNGMCDSQVGDNAEVSLGLFDISVTDRDGLDNSQLNYSIISGNNQGHFDLDSTTGMLSLMSSLDRDMGDESFLLQAAVSDGQFEGILTIIIQVLDENDNDPVPMFSTFTASLVEGSPVNTFVVTTRFTDPDDGLNSRLVYSTSSPDFTILDSTVANIYASRVFDFESGDRYFIFVVRALDSSSSPRVAEANITVTILDINDNRPTVWAILVFQYLEDFGPVVPASLIVIDIDSETFPLLFAAITITNPLDKQYETLYLNNSMLPRGFKLGYYNFTLFIVGSDTPSIYSRLLSSIMYENTAVLFELPLYRNISYGVCDMLRDTSLLPSLTPDTQQAFSSMATETNLPSEDASILLDACLQLVSEKVTLFLNESNDRPVLQTVQVDFPPQPEDLPIEENIGYYVIDIFESAFTDTDRDSVLGIAVVGQGSATTLESGFVRSNQDCLRVYEQISSIGGGGGGCDGRQLNSSEFCECQSPSILSCIVSPSQVIFLCLDGRNAKSCTCSLPTQQAVQSSLPEFSDILSLAIDFGSGDLISITDTLIVGQWIEFPIILSEELYNLTFSLSIFNVTLLSGDSFLSPTPSFDIVYEPLGDLKEDAALVLGPYDLIRWTGVTNINGVFSFHFKGWDTTNAILFGTREVNTSLPDDTSFSLATGIARLVITPVNDAPIILLGGTEADLANYSTVYTEGTAVHVADSNATVLDYDIEDRLLINLVGSISAVGGNCQLVDYPRVSHDVLINDVTAIMGLTVIFERLGQACARYTFLGNMTIGNWQSFITSLRFNVTDEEPSDHTRELAFVINDAMSSSLPVYTTIDVVLVSDTCPVLSLTTTNPVSYTEGGPPVILSSMLVISDGDRNPLIRSASVQIVQTSNAMCSMCELVLSNASLPSQITALFSQTSLVLTLMGNASPVEYQRLLRDVAFLDRGLEPSFDLVTVRFNVQDLSLMICQAAMTDIGVMVEHINDNSPEIYLNYPTSQDYSQIFTEGVESVHLTGQQVFILDVDGVDSLIYRVRVAIAADCQTSEDHLEFSSDIHSSLISQYDITNCSLELEGNSTVLVYDLSRLIYRNTDIDSPTSLTRSVEFIISDEDLPPQTSTTVLIINSVNDKPLIDLDIAHLFSPNATRQFTDSSVSITGVMGGLITDPEDDLLERMTLVLTEVDSLGNEVARSDALFEVLEVPATILDLFNLTGTFLFQTSQFVITGLSSAANYTVVLNSCLYVNRRFPPSGDNERQVTVTISDSSLSSSVVMTTITFRVSTNRPILDLNGDGVGINAEAEYTSTSPHIFPFPKAILMDLDGDNICNLNITLSGTTCPPTLIIFSNAYPDISLDTTDGPERINYLLTTSFIDCRKAIVFEDVLRGVTFSNMNMGSSGTCTLTVIAAENQKLMSPPAVATIKVRAFNTPPFIDLDLGLGGRDFSTIYFQGGRTQHIVSIFDANTSHNITDMTVVGEAMIAGEAPETDTSLDSLSFDDGTIFHGVVILEESNAGYVLRDIDSDTLVYLQVEFFSGVHLEQDVISYPCAATVPLLPYGCKSSDSAPITFMAPTCNNFLFDACRIQDLCTDLKITIFCRAPGRKAYRFEYTSNAVVRRYEILLGMLGYDFLPPVGGQINQIRLLNITVFDPFSNSVNPLAITRIRIRNQEVLIIERDLPDFIVYEDERPLRTSNLYQISVRRLDGTVPPLSEVVYAISQGNTGDAFGVTEEGVIFLNNYVDRETISRYNLTITARIRTADPDTTSSAILTASVVDVNDNPPVTADSYTVNVSELVVNTSVVQLVVTDRDEGENAELMYFLRGIGEEMFSIDRNGLITTTVGLNRTIEDYYLLVVIIYDRGVIPLATHTVINVMVISLPPTQLAFNSLPILYVNENTAPGIMLELPLSAFEVSGSESTEFIRYRFISIRSDQTGDRETPDPFAVNFVTGVISVVSDLDSERTSSYSALAEAYSNRPLLPPMSAFVNITFKIIDQNEFPPIFVNATYVLTVVEDIPPGTTLATLVATDNDQMNQRLIYSLSSRIPSNFPFNVEEDGDLVVVNSIDYEFINFYTFEVQVSDGPAAGMRQLQGSATVNVTVLDRNDNAPVFLDTPYNRSVLETDPDGTVILSISSEDSDSLINREVKYSAVGLEMTPFCLYQDSIFIEVCNSSLLTSIEQEGEIFDFDLMASNPPGYGSITQVTTVAVSIELVLVNEFDPQSTVQVVKHIGYHEEHCGRGQNTTCVGVVVFDFSSISSDADGGLGGELNYYLVNTGVPFSVDAASGVLSMSGRIDREEQDMYSLDVKVTDEGDSNNLVRSTVITINIPIFDIDDNLPIIVEPYVFYVTENSTATTNAFGQINVTDLDINGTQHFNIIPFSSLSQSSGCIIAFDVEYLPIFLDPLTGELSFCQEINFEDGPNSFVFQVEVVDSGNYSVSERIVNTDVKNIMVNILDSNDNRPMFSTGQNLDFSIYENEAAETSIGSVKASDGDSGINSLLQFSVVGGSSPTSCVDDLPFYTVMTSDTSAEIVQCHGLDYEAQQTYHFLVQVEDSGLESLSSTTSVSVTVFDRNDNPPIFDKDEYFMQLLETDSSLLMAPVIRVGVSDLDSPPNSISTFNIISPPMSPFGLRASNSSHVELFVADPQMIDFENDIISYEVIIEATNAVGGDLTLSSTTIVNITIVDVNDNAPAILQPFMFAVRENQPANAAVGLVNARDADTGASATLKFFIRSRDADQSCSSGSLFVISNTSGQISTCHPLDYESNIEYSILVVVCDSTEPPMCSNRTFTVNLVDLNDNSPVFDEDPFIVNLNELSSTGTLVDIITSTDNDSAENSNITYFLQNIDIPFLIIGNEVYFNGSNTELDYEHGSRSYIVNIRGENPPAIQDDVTRVSSVVLVINVIDRNNNPPVFPAMMDSVNIPEHLQEGEVLYSLATTDEDSLENSRVVYSIVESETPFMIVGSDITVQDNAAIDYDPPSNVRSYMLTIHATNYPAVRDDQTQTADFTLLVNVDDINDNSPVCVGRTSFTIFEDALINVELVEITAEDIDAGLNGNQSLLFSTSDIAMGDPLCSDENMFHIDPDSGFISICQALDYEQRTTYRVNFTVCDMGVPLHRCSSCPVLIIINDVNDNAPVVNSSTTFSVSEIAPIGTEISCVNVQDADSGQNALLQYHLGSTVDNCSFFTPFSIDEHSGCLFVCFPLDFEVIEDYIFVVNISDHGSLVMFTVVNFTVFVQNENDHPPEITSADTASVLEELANAFVIQVTSQDVDQPPFNTPTFSLLTNSGGSFAISTVSGVVTTAIILDREQQVDYGIVVLVSDGLNAVNQSITVSLIDINDNPPEYLGQSSFTFREEFLFETVLVFRDNDTGFNADLSYSVDDLRFEVDNNGVLKNTERFDRDPMTGGSPELEVTVTIRDTSSSPRELRVPLTISLTDINDNAPQLHPIMHDIVDGTRRGELVATAQAIDPDDGVNAELRYFLGGPSSMFAIDESSGEIRLLQDIFIASDSAERLVVVVNVSDTGIPINSDSIVAEFYVVSSRPQFLHDTYNFTIAENRFGEDVGVVHAMDRDNNPFNDVFIYSILSVSPYNAGFSVRSDLSTGTLVTPVTYLDYEDAHTFNFILAVGRVNMTSIIDDTVNVVLFIGEVNDNVPWLSPVNMSVEVFENSAVGTLVAKPVAIDFDAGASGAISYNISGDGAQLFSFNSNGDLVVREARINFEQTSTYGLTYQACDNGTPRRCSEIGYIFVNVVDVDDLPPVFFPTSYSIEIPEAFESMLFVLNVNITDEDTALEDLTIFLHPLQSMFQVILDGSDKLVITTTDTPLDREEQEQYQFNVVAIDSSGSEASASVSVSISDINDERPQVLPTSGIVVRFEEEGPAIFPANGLNIVDRDTLSLYPLTRTLVSLQPDPTSTSGYPNEGGICDHANYSILYDNNSHSLCGQENCLYLLLENEVNLRETGSILANGVLNLPGISNTARNSEHIFHGEKFGNFTITIWVKFPAQTSGNLFEVQSAGVNVFELSVDLDGSLGVLTRTSQTASRLLLRSPNLSTHDGQWHLIAFIRNGSSLILYFDCEEVASTVDNNNIRTDFTTGSFFIGFELSNVFISEFYFCSSVVVSRLHICCTLSCGEHLDLMVVPPNVDVLLNPRNRSVELVYTGAQDVASLSSLVYALRNVRYYNQLDEPHPLDRGLLVMAFDEVNVSDSPAVIALRPILHNDKRPILDLNGTANPGLNLMTTSDEIFPSSLIIGEDAQLYDGDSGFLTIQSVTVELLEQRDHRLIIPSDLPSGLIATFTNLQRTVLLESIDLSWPQYADTYMEVLRQVRYSNLVEEQNQFAASIQYRVRDAVGLENSPLPHTIVTVLPTNDPPELDLNTADPSTLNTQVEFDESKGFVNLIGNNLSIEDSDSDMLSQAIVSFILRPDGLRETLRIDPLFSDMITSSSFNSTLGVLIITHTADFSTWLSILKVIQYVNDEQDPSASMRQLAVVVQDDGGALSDSVFVHVSITLENDPPQLFLGGPGMTEYTVIFTEDGPCVPLVSSDVVIIEPDSAGILFLQIRLAGNVGTATESIMFNGNLLSGTMIFPLQGGGLFIVVTPDTPAAYAEVLRNIIYCNTADEPDETGVRQVDYFIVDNGLAVENGNPITSQSSTSVSTVSILRVNDQPAISFMQLNDISIRDIATAIINSSTIMIDDSDDILFDILQIIITNAQDGSDDEIIQFARMLPSSSISRGPTELPGNQILYTVTFTGGADVERITETISQLRYNNLATDVTAEPPRVVCIQLRDFKLFSNLSCVNVSISPPNFHHPVFIINKNTSEYTFSENDSLSTIATFLAVDEDTGREGTIVYSIKSVLSTSAHGMTFTLDIFTIDASSGELVAPNGLNAEDFTSHSITVVASDQGNPVRSDSIAIQVYVTDINDEAPVFVNTPYTAPSQREDLNPPNNIFTVVAMDGDSSLANRQDIRFDLINLQDRFSIDRITGVIQSIVFLNAEEQQIYLLNVSATDSGNPPLASYTSVNFTLLDANDNEARVEQLAPAVYITNRDSSSIGPAIRIVDEDLSPSVISTIEIHLTPSMVDLSRTYDRCLVPCQNTRLLEAGLTNAIDLLRLSSFSIVGASMTTVGSGDCPAVSLNRGNTLDTDGFGEIPRSSLPSDFGTGDFSVSFVLTQISEGYVLIMPSTTIRDPITSGNNQDRQFGIWLRRNILTFYYRVASSALVQTVRISAPSNALFFDRDNIQTKHFTFVATRNTVIFYMDCEQVGSAVLSGTILQVNPAVNLFVGSARPHPSISGGRLAGELSGLYYHQQALSSQQIIDFCSCGFEALVLPTLPPSITGSIDSVSRSIFLTGTSGGTIPNGDIAIVLRSINYTNQFHSPDVSMPTRALQFFVREANEEVGRTDGLLFLVTSDANLPTVNLAVLGMHTSTLFVEDGGPVLVSPEAEINRDIATFSVIPTFSHVRVSLTNSVDAGEVLNATGSEFISAESSNNGQTLDIVGPGISREFNAVLRTITYNNLNNNPTTSVQRTVTYLAYDTKGFTNMIEAVSTVTLQSVNDPPQIYLEIDTVSLMGVVHFQEGTEGVLVFPNIIIMDIDSVNLESATLTLTSPAMSSDTLNVSSSARTAINVKYNQSTGELSLSGLASLHEYQILLSRITFVSTDSPFLDSSVESLTRRVILQVSDGQMSSNSATIQLEFIPNNDAPTIMLNSLNVVFQDGDVEVPIAPTANIMDSDNRQLLSMTVELEGSQDNNVLKSGSTTNRVLRFGENSIADMVALLRSINYVNLAAEPSLIPRVIDITVCDFVLCGKANITIDIVDVNDNKPLFSRKTYTFSVGEDSGLSTTVGTLHVIDADTEATSSVFSIESQIFTLLSEVSSVHIITASLLNFEQTSSYAFNITANDGVNNDSAQVLISVEDVNEPPSLTFIPAQPAIMVSSASMNNLIQVQFEIFDPDFNDTIPTAVLALLNIPNGSNESLTWNQVPEYSFVEVSNKVYKLSGSGDATSLSQALRRVIYIAGDVIVRPTAIRLVSIVLVDRSGISSIEARVTLSLASIPQFSESSYSISLQEEMVVADFMQVQATVQSGGNEIIYHVEQGRGITINTSTGFLSLQEALNREESSSHLFNVFAIDELPPARTGTASVNITVLDINDVRPTVTGINNITLVSGDQIMPFDSVKIEDPDTVGAILTSTISVIGNKPLEQSPFTYRVCVDESDLITKMVNVCGGLAGGIVLLEENLLGVYSLSSGVNAILTLSDSDYATVSTNTSNFSGRIDELSFVSWLRAEGSGYIVYFGTPDSVERYFALYYSQMRNQLIVTVKREGVSGLSGQVRVNFQLTAALDDEAYHFVMVQYLGNSMECVVDGVQASSVAVVYKEEPFIGQVFGKYMQQLDTLSCCCSAYYKKIGYYVIMCVNAFFITHFSRATTCL